MPEQHSDPNRPAFVEATSSTPNDIPSVLINFGGGPVNFIEVSSQMAGNEKLRVVFSNGSDYHLDGSRAGTLLHRLRERGFWTPAPETAVGAGGRQRT